MQKLFWHLKVPPEKAYLLCKEKKKKKKMVGELAQRDGDWHCNRKTRWWLRGFADSEAAVCTQVNIDVFERRKSVGGT